MTKEKIPQIKAKPVFSVEAEAAVLGSLILKNELFDEISTLIHADDFFNYTHKIIFEGIVHLLQLGKPVDILTLEQYFTDKSLIDEFGLGYLAQIVNNTPSSSNIVAYAKVIARHSKQRRFAALGQFIVNEMQVSKDDEDLSLFEERVDKQYTNITVDEGAFAKSLGAIGVGPGGFAIFPDAETGARAVGALMRTQNYKTCR